jgi:hypothetical protein
MAARVLDRLAPPDWEHVSKYALAALAEPVRGIPVIFGWNWYSDFDNPELISISGHKYYFVARNGIKGTIRGGHCIASKPGDLSDLHSWWVYYNQGEEGACVSFGCNRAMSILNRKEYDPWKFYNEIKLPGGGALVRNGLEELRTEGPVNRHTGEHVVADGISAYRWAQSVAEIHQVLANPVADRLHAVPILNSWGANDYPHLVYVPDDVVERLMSEDGEAGVVTDK